MKITYTRQEDGTFKKEGEIGAVPEVRIKIGGQEPFSNTMTLAEATKVVEDAIAKGQVKHDLYSILAEPEKPLSGAAKANSEKKARGEKVEGPKRKKKVENDESQKESKDILPAIVSDDSAGAATGRIESDGTTVEKPVDNRPRLDHDKVKELYAAGQSVGQIAKAIGASYAGTHRILAKAGLLRKEVAEVTAA